MANIENPYFRGICSPEYIIKITIFFIILMIPLYQLYAGVTIAGSFKLTLTRGDDKEISSGFFYFTQDGVLKVQVTNPLEQWMFFTGDTLLIYYPDENSGLKIPSIQGDVTLPIFQLAINAANDDLGIINAGYELSNTSISGDTLTAIWSPPTATRSVLGNITSVYVHDSLMSVVSTNGDGDTVVIQNYSQWIVHKGKLFPCSVLSMNLTRPQPVTESIIFKGLIMGAKLPEEAVLLAVPQDANLTTISW